MTGPEPPDRDRSADGDEHDATEAAFAEIVAGWDDNPAAVDVPEPADDEPEPAAQTRPLPGPVPAIDDEEHYVPPEPPPIPVLAPRTFCGVLAIVAGIVMMIFPGLVAMSSSVAVPVGLLTIAGGIGWLLMGLRDDPEDEADGWDDGAQL